MLRVANDAAASAAAAAEVSLRAPRTGEVGWLWLGADSRGFRYGSRNAADGFPSAPDVKGLTRVPFTA
jgi:hypothetical protein